MTNFSSWPPQQRLAAYLLMKLKIFAGKSVKFGRVVREAWPERMIAEDEKAHSVYNREKSLDRKEVFSKATSFLWDPEGSHI